MQQHELPNDEIMNDEEVKELVAQREKTHREMQKKAVDRFMKKNKRELKRLEEHAKESLILGNESGYIYSLNKLRSMTGRAPVSNEQAKEMYRQSKIVTDETIRKAIRDSQR